LLLLLGGALSACSVGDAGPRGQQTPIVAGTSAPSAPVTVVPLDPTSPGASSQVVGAGNAVKVALLVPTSGSQAALGQALQDAAQLAVFEVADKSFTLTTYDTGDSASGAAAAARKATGEGAKLLLGPVFGPATREVAPVASGSSVGVVSFSNDPSVAGGGVYVLGFQPRDQVSRVVGYAASKGLKRIALLAPGNDYGRLVQDALNAAAARHGVTVPQSRLYNPRGTDVDAEARALAQAGDFDAVLIPEGGARLRQIAQTLGQQKSVKLLGTGQWDDAGTTAIPGLAGAWFATSAPEQYA
jgi:ABC-type branched-subunit amino acid transport system substrate-binding protein